MTSFLKIAVWWTVLAAIEAVIAAATKSYWVAGVAVLFLGGAIIMAALHVAKVNTGRS